LALDGSQYDKDENIKFFLMEKGDVGLTAALVPSAVAATAGVSGSGRGSRRRHGKTLTKITWMQGELLGSGSCGQVFLGLNVDTGRLIAVKQVEHRRDSVSNMNGVRTDEFTVAHADRRRRRLRPRTSGGPP
jgi:serine/threonine protein kinase